MPEWIVQVILYQPGGAAKENSASVPAHAAIPVSITAMDISPQRGHNAGLSHEVAELPASALAAGEQHSPNAIVSLNDEGVAVASVKCRGVCCGFTMQALCAGNAAGHEVSADPFSIYASAHGPQTAPQQQPSSPSRHLGVSVADMPGSMADAYTANGQGTAAVGTSGPPDLEGFLDDGDRAPSRADSQQLGATGASERRAAPPHMTLPGDDAWVSGGNWLSSSTLQAQEFGHPAAGASSAGKPHGSSAAGAVFSGPAMGISGGFAQLYWQEQQQQQQQEQQQVQQQQQQQHQQEEQQQRFPQPQPYAGIRTPEHVFWAMCAFSVQQLPLLLPRH